MFKANLVRQIIRSSSPPNNLGVGFAPSNLALIKYWGKRDEELKLPTHSSLAVTLGYYGTVTIIRFSDHEQYFLNDQAVSLQTPFAIRLKAFLDLFRRPQEYFQIETRSNLPIASGFASSASGFAALVLALNELYHWQLPLNKLSILARLGSGSACRSLQHGFISWAKGERADGLDSYGTKITDVWPDLCIGILPITKQPKKYSSTQAMYDTTHSLHFPAWTTWSETIYLEAKQAILQNDFERLAVLSEKHTEAMHALISDAHIEYSCFETFRQIQRIKNLSKKGLPVFYTQDAGANLFVLTLKETLPQLKKYFPLIEINPKVSDANVAVLNLQGQKVPKIRTHILGEPHLAFSIILYRYRHSKIEFLIQQRSNSKYHAANLWSNTCCGHPTKEILLDAQNRLKEEMGINLPLKQWGEMRYQVKLGNFIEHELDYFCWGNGQDLTAFNVNPDEVQNWQWIDVDLLTQKVQKDPSAFTPWFIQILAWLKPRWSTWYQLFIR